MFINIIYIYIKNKKQKNKQTKKKTNKPKKNKKNKQTKKNKKNNVFQTSLEIIVFFGFLVFNEYTVYKHLWCL